MHINNTKRIINKYELLQNRKRKLVMYQRV
jgi:hypothetical protein